MTVVSLNEGYAIGFIVRACEAIGVTLVNYRVGRIGELLADPLLRLADLGKLAARDDDTVLVNYTDGSSYCILYLMYYRLE